MILNQILIVAVVALASWWLVRAIGHLRDADAGRNEKFDVEAAAGLLVLGMAGIALSSNATIQIAGGVAIVVGTGAGFAMRRRNRRE